MRLYQQLEQTFKLRINSNSEIIPYIKKLSEMGKFDEPKKVAAIAILLDRLGKLEDEISPVKDNETTDVETDINEEKESQVEEIANEDTSQESTPSSV